MNQPENAVVLAVGPAGVDAALTFAVDEARRSHRPLHLVHVLQMPAGDAYVGVYGGVLEAASLILDHAMARARELAAGEIPVTSELVDHGYVVEELVHRSRSAHLVVLQRRAIGRLRRIFAGSVSSGVAAKAHAPVVSVPADSAPVGSRPLLVITAAVQSPEGAEPLLRTAFEEARVRGVPLVVLHAWWLGDVYDNLTRDPATRVDWEERTGREFEPVLTPLQERYPDVEVSLVVRNIPPAEAILDAADSSELLVIARRHHLLPLGTHLGPVARAVLAGSTCPVLVTPEVDALVAAG
jgi:nucleotide-binding universal stress UspA family protein